MASVPLDTLRVSQRLREVGFSQPQAETVAYIVSDTRSDAAGNAVTPNQMSVALNDLKSELRSEIREAKIDLIKWMVPLMFGQTAIIVALVKLL